MKNDIFTQTYLNIIKEQSISLETKIESYILLTKLLRKEFKERLNEESSYCDVINYSDGTFAIVSWGWINENKKYECFDLKLNLNNGIISWEYHNDETGVSESYELDEEENLQQIKIATYIVENYIKYDTNEEFEYEPDNDDLEKLLTF